MKAINKTVPFLFLFLLAPYSFSFAQDFSPNVAVSTASKTVAEIYKPGNLRDPMIVSPVFASQTENRELVSAQPQVQISSFTIKNLVLTGIIEYSDRKKEALLKDKGTGAVYVFKGGFLYDGKKNRVQGVKGSIKGKQVTLVSDEEKSAPVEFVIKDPYPTKE